MVSVSLDINSEIDKLIKKSESTQLPEGVRYKLEEVFQQLKVSAKSESSFWENYQRTSKYIDWVISLPWYKQSEDILDLNYAKEKLDENHYGLDSIKERILEYISVLALQKHRRPGEKMRAPVLLFLGLVGTGKTTMAKSVADIMGRKLVRIPFGGLGDPLYLRGQSRMYPESEPGAIIRGIRDVGVNNPVILLDEIDRVADSALQTIMGVLVELLDPEQNDKFTDHYIDYPFDLSQAMFVATCNNTTRIATAVMDRLELIQMPSYTDEEKVNIGKKYLLPRALKDSGISPDELQVADDIWLQVVRPLGFDAGVRTLKRNIEGMCRKTATIIFSGQAKKVLVDQSNVKQFIPQW